tara:strand:- start:1128 stop:1379 length:252 start_codon:yes stop_codon:yes gene_type:complete
MGKYYPLFRYLPKGIRPRELKRLHLGSAFLLIAAISSNKMKLGVLIPLLLMIAIKFGCGRIKQKTAFSREGESPPVAAFFIPS